MDLEPADDTPEAIIALARRFGVAPTLEAIAEYYRLTGLPTRNFARVNGGPECAPDREKAIQRHRRELELAERKIRMGTKDLTPAKLERLEKMRLTKEANQQARDELFERHAEEFDELTRKARVERGLPETPPLPAKGKMEQLREQLRAAGLEPKV